MKLSLLAHQFQLVFKGSENFVVNNLKFQFLVSKQNLIGFTIKKTLGGATERSCFKRQCRSLFLATFKNKPEIHLVVSPQKRLKQIDNIDDSFKQLKQYVCS